MGPVEALKLALSKEIASLEVYKKLAVSHQGLKDLFSFLINEEEKHRKLIEKKIWEFTK